MNTKFNFDPEPTTLEELKAVFRTAAKKFHPDFSHGDLKTMQAVNAEYDRLFPLLKSKHKTADGTEYTKETNEMPDDFKDLINILIRMESVEIHVIGSFIWLTGNTKPYKDQLKELNFQWHNGKKSWFLKPIGYTRKSRRKTTLEELKTMYGGNSMKSKGMTKLEESTA